MANKLMQNEDLVKGIIVLRSVYGKSVKDYFIQPCKDELGNYPECVRRVDANGDMIITEADKSRLDELVAIDHTFVVRDGTVLDLSNPRQKAEWECIKRCPIIAKSRYKVDSNGNPKIDPSIDGDQTNREKPRYGVAELYVDVPGLIANSNVSRAKKVKDAYNYIFDDERGNDGRVLRAKLIGRDFSNKSDADVTDFLIQIADKDPDRIINLYTSDDIGLQLCFVEARNKKVIYFKNKLFQYGDNIILGATQDAAILWMKNPSNKKIVELIKRETFPDMYLNELKEDSKKSKEEDKK